MTASAILSATETSAQSAVRPVDPSIPAHRHDHAVAMATTEMSAPMVGDPKMILPDQLCDRYVAICAIRYATEMVRGKGKIGYDMSRLDAHFVPPKSVNFVRADASQKVVRRYKIQDRVLAFNPSRPAKAIEDKR